METTTSTERMCSEIEWKCVNSGECLQISKRCNGVRDCADGSDEFNCPPDPTVYPTYPDRTEVEAKPEPEVKPEVQPKPDSLVETETFVPRCDPWHERTCHSGGCVSKEQICDGQPDCSDGSDEWGCSELGIASHRTDSTECEPNEFRCRNGVCGSKIWICDGEMDCEDGSDEENCDIGTSASVCMPTQFHCGDMECIKKSYQCDGESDCSNGSDEENCARPHITKPPQSETHAQDGSTIVLKCEAVGKPTPVISWRKNWGPTCEEPRCSQHTKNGVGKLVIENIKPDDQGAYTCEAMNSRGNQLATPDAVLFVSAPDVTSSNCPSGTFKGPDSSCVDCWCNGLSTQCSQMRIKMKRESIDVSVQKFNSDTSDFDIVPKASSEAKTATLKR